MGSSCSYFNLEVVDKALSFFSHVHDADDSFVTPPSTPPVEKEEEFMSISDTADGLLSGVSNQTILEKMYERYAAIHVAYTFFSFHSMYCMY